MDADRWIAVGLAIFMLVAILFCALTHPFADVIGLSISCIVAAPIVYIFQWRKPKITFGPKVHIIINLYDDDPNDPLR